MSIYGKATQTILRKLGVATEQEAIEKVGKRAYNKLLKEAESEAGAEESKNLPALIEGRDYRTAIEMPERIGEPRIVNEFGGKNPYPTGLYLPPLDKTRNLPALIPGRTAQNEVPIPDFPSPDRVLELSPDGKSARYILRQTELPPDELKKLDQYSRMINSEPRDDRTSFVDVPKERLDKFTQDADFVDSRFRGLRNLPKLPELPDEPVRKAVKPLGLAIGAGGMLALSGDRAERSGVPPMPRPAPRKEEPLPAALEQSKVSGRSSQNPVAAMRGIGPVANPDLYGAAIEKKQLSEPSAEAGVEAGDSIKIRDADRKRLDSRLQAYDNAVSKLRKAGVDTSGFDAEAKELKAAYKEAKTRNEWLEVAQLVGQALARFGAYAQGARDGKLIAPGMDIPSVDYSKRTGQEFEDYRTSLQDVATRRREASDAANEAYNAELRKLALQDLGVKTEQNIYDQQMASNRAEAQLRAGLRADARKDAAVSARESSALFNQASNIADDAARDERAVAAKLSATQAALETYLKPANSKQKKKAAADLAAANVDTATVDNALKESGGIIFSDPQEAKQMLISGGLLDHLQVQLEEIRKRKARAESIMNKHMGTDTGTEKAQTAAPVTSMVRIRMADGREGQVPANQVEAFLQKHSGSQVVK